VVVGAGGRQGNEFPLLVPFILILFTVTQALSLAVPATVLFLLQNITKSTMIVLEILKGTP